MLSEGVGRDWKHYILHPTEIMMCFQSAVKPLIISNCHPITVFGGLRARNAHPYLANGQSTVSVALWSSHVACYRRGGPLCPPSKQVTTGVTPTSGRLGAIGAVSGMKMGNMIVPASSPSTGFDRQDSS